MRPHFAEARQNRAGFGRGEFAALQALLQGVPEQDSALDAHGHSLAVDGVEAGRCITQHTQPLQQVHLHNMLMQSTSAPIVRE